MSGGSVSQAHEAKLAVRRGDSDRWRDAVLKVRDAVPEVLPSVLRALGRSPPGASPPDVRRFVAESADHVHVAAPEEVAEVIAWLCTDTARLVTGNVVLHVRFPGVDEPRAERPDMADYGVDTPAWVPLPWSWAAERLIANRNFWVVTVSAAGRPHALPVWGAWDDDEGRFAFSCAPRARKARNLAANPRAVIMTDDTVECLSIEGRADRVGGNERQGRWIERYLAKYQPISPDISAAFLRQNLIIEFEPERAFGVIEREEEFSTRATRWMFRT